MRLAVQLDPPKRFSIAFLGVAVRARSEMFFRSHRAFRVLSLRRREAPPISLTTPSVCAMPPMAFQLPDPALC